MGSIWNGGVLILDADITVHLASSVDQFMSLASDGFGDVISAEVACALTSKWIEKYVSPKRLPRREVDRESVWRWK